MGKKLLIVESPAKAKTIGKYLGGDFVVKSSVGHVRDLPEGNGAVKIAEAGDGKWTFTPTYVVSEGKEKVVSELKSAVKGADEIYLASDPDREGEAIAWHLKEVLGPAAGKKPFRRVTYNEITKGAVLKAVESPRDIDMPLVDAQQARRILDRLVGYKVSPLLWKNVNCPNSRTLSAGRVQSVALRLLVERQREIDAFKPEKYFVMGVEARKRGDEPSFAARLARLDGKKPEIRDRQGADNLLLDLRGAGLAVAEVKAQPKTRHALPPFTTSTLQQAASSVLGFSPGKTMKLAQALYEQGRITYMRTDSVNVSDQARAAAKEYVAANFGEEYCPAKPNIYKSKAGSQGAHEAIRPTDVALSPEAAGLDGPEARLYDLVWRRFLASQMADARTTVRTVALEARKTALAHTYLFTASATEIDFDGFLKVMKLSLKRRPAQDEETDEDTDEVDSIPELSAGEELDVVRWLSDERETKGPAHYSEAALVKALEENGVGRPSTYAQTIETLKSREYAKTEKRKLVPLERGFLVCDWLVKKLDPLFNVGYTAQMESELDKVEEGGEKMDDMLSEFYSKFRKSLAEAQDPPPDRAKFEVVFSLLEQVKNWKPAKKVGKRIYDDKAFVESVKDQMEAGERPLSARQLEFLVRMVSMYADQIPNAEQTLKESGIGAGAVVPTPKADDGLVKYCFDVMDRIGGMTRNPFLKSLREQYDRGRPLSQKQFAILARSVGENATALEDCADVREKLSEFVSGGFSTREADPVIPSILKMLDGVKNWREVAKRGHKVYDDQVFVKSLADQFARRRSLSPRQAAALRRVAAMYADQIPDYAEKAEALGLPDPAKFAEQEEETGKRRRRHRASDDA